MRKFFKWLIYGYMPGLSGSFSYYGTKTFFPKNSYLFRQACTQGIYELENTLLLTNLAKPGSFYFDIGANLGFMSLPVLYHCPECQVVSIEASPNNLKFLQKTFESSTYKDRWQVVGKAAGDTVGSQTFSISTSEMGAFDGFQNTNRAGKMSQVTVEVTTIDTEWEKLNRPQVSLIKIDVEGSELQVLKGASHCIEQEKPAILLEWNLMNLKAYSCPPSSLFSWSKDAGYSVFSLPNLIPLLDRVSFDAQTLKYDNFLLLPKL